MDVSEGRGRSAIPMLLSSALAHHQAGRLTEAYEIYRRIQEVDPQHADAMHLLGVIAYQLDQPEESVNLISSAISLRGDNPDYFVNLGNALQACTRYREAVAAFARADQLDPGRPETLFNLGNVLWKAGDRRNASAAFRQAVAARADFADAWLNLGLVLHEMEELAQAERILNQAATLRPDHAETVYAHGLVLRDLNQPAAAEQQLAAAITLDPHHAAAHDALGGALRALGRLDDAVIAYRLAIELEPDFAAAHYNLAGTLQDMGRIEETLVHYRRCLELDPTNDSARHMVAALSGETTPTAPAGYVRDMFDGYASGFEAHLVSVLGYKAHDLLREAADRAWADAGETAAFQRGLDMGCGTGLVGAAFCDIVNTMDGIDLAPGMIAESRRKGIYDALFEADLLEFLVANDESYDLLLAADLFIYIGDLHPVFAALTRRAAPGATFVFSVEMPDPQTEPGDYVLRTSGRYAQDDTYIRRLANEFGWSVCLDEVATLRHAAGKPIAGQIFVLRRND